MPTIFTDEDHPGKILQTLWEQCEKRIFCDVLLIAGTAEIKIPAHRSVLSAASEYFNGMFMSSMVEATSNYVRLPSVDGYALKSLVEFCYTGRVEISNEIVMELLKTADMLLLNNVVTACGNFLTMQLDPANCLGLALLAEQYRCDILLEQSKDYSLEQFMEVYKTEEFLNLSADQLGELLASDDLNVTDEKEVFNSIVKWIAYNPSARQKHKADLLKMVRMPLLEEPSFLNDALACDLLSHDDLAKLVISTKPRRSYQFLMVIKKCELTLESLSHKMSIQYYCLQQEKWMKCLKTLDYRTYFGIALMGNDLYIIGGANSRNRILNTIICLNLKTMNFKQVEPMTECRSGCSAAYLNGFLYVVGGANMEGFLNSVERWDPEINKWSAMTSMSVSRYRFGIAVVNNKLYAVGGLSDGAESVVSAECYDPMLNVWNSIAPTSCSSPMVAVINGILYAVDSQDNPKMVECYDLINNKWILVAPGGSECRNFKCISFRDKILIFYLNGSE